MPVSTSASRHASRFIVQRVSFLPGTGRKLAVVAKSLGLRYNPTGRLLDMCVDLIATSAASLVPRRKGYGCVPVATVRLIRRSKDKIAVIALEHHVSEAMVSKIRARKRYAWVR